MRTPRIVHLSFAVMLLAGLLPLAATAQPAAPIEPELLGRLQAGGNADFFVKMVVEADLSPAYGMEWEARGEFVWQALNDVARSSQARVLDYCQKNGLDCTSYVATNAVLVRAGALDAAQELAVLPGVAALRLERTWHLPEAPVSSSDEYGSGGSVTSSQAGETSPEATTAWGLLDTHADGVWAMGFKGAGIKVAITGTGVQWDHPALEQAFACTDPSDSRCWYDPENACGGSACDTNGLDTHLMGTMVGDHDPSLTYRAGMAPDAQWIACKGCPANSCPDSVLLACADWILHPGGDSINRPHIVLNPWGRSGGDDWFLPRVQVWRAAGIFPVFDAAVGGPSCGTLRSPADLQESMTSAGHDSERTILSNSGRGPSAFGHEPFTKPNLSAPGGSTCSSVPGDGWSCGYSFPVNASAHTAGAVALVWQACPLYQGDIDGTMELLQSTADPAPAGDCGAPPDGEGNYTYGYGYLNVLRAVEQCTASGGPWTYYGPLCFELYRFDGYYDPGTDKAFFLGGRTGSQTYPDIYSFDPVTGACADTGEDMPVAISNYTVVPLRSGKTTYLCTFGGRNSAGAMIRDVQCYDPATNTAAIVGEIPEVFDTYLVGGAAAVNNKAYIFGGYRSTATPFSIDATYEWDPGTGKWTKKGNLSLSRAYIMTAVVDDMIYAFGGDVWDGSGLVAQTTAERFDPSTGLWNNVAVADLPVASGEGRAYGFDSTSRYTVKGQVVIAGGGQWPDETVAGMVYDVASNSYDHSFPDLNVARRNHAGFFEPGTMARLWVVGGHSSEPGYNEDSPPYGPGEYVDLLLRVYLPVVMRSWAP